MLATSVPGQLDFSIEFMATSIMLTKRTMESVVDQLMFKWWRDTSVGCPVNHDGNKTSSGTDTTFVIENLEEDSTYFITVIAINRAGSSLHNITAMTQEAGIMT